MNRTKLKNYAPQARLDFIQAVTQRAAVYGLTKEKIEPISEQGDVAIIDGKPFPRSLADRRRRLEERIARLGFEPVMEAVAYTWFNRLVAVRFMELHGYLDHGYRVLSHPDKSKPVPEIVEHAEHINLPGLNPEKVIALKLDGTKEADLYQMLLIAQCNAMSSAMPFLFERIDDETELLLPDNLLHSDSLIRKLVSEIDEADWERVEIIGWLYQFYISDKKDEVIGKVVKSEDIPAATQLFTPNWIVKYLVQNSLGRKWLSTYPASPLRLKMAFYIEPAEQTPEVQAQLAAITPESLNPEEVTLMDPACGSGHILVEGYDLLKEIYLERGYRLRDIPKLILTKNLFGLEIDDRAAQLAAFALMMKARADDRRIFDAAVQPSVLAIQESNGLNLNAIVQTFTDTKITNEDDTLVGEFGFVTTTRAPLFATENRTTATVDDKFASDLKSLFVLFENAKTFGSLIQVPPILTTKLEEIEQRLDALLRHGDLIHTWANAIKPLLRQAGLLAKQYDAVVANPPYMGTKAMNVSLKLYAATHYPISKPDLFAMFIERNCRFAHSLGYAGFMTPFVWLFIDSYQPLRRLIVSSKSISSLVHPEYNAFWESAHVTICAFVLRNALSDAKGDYVDLRKFAVAETQPLKLLEAISTPECGWRYSVASTSLAKIPGFPIAYWVSDRIRNIFSSHPTLESVSPPKAGMSTGRNEDCIFYWWEVNVSRIGYGQSQRSEKYRFYPHNKAGGFRRWYGHTNFILKYSNADIARMETYLGFRHDNRELYFRESMSWGKITSSLFSARYYPAGYTFDGAGLCVFVKEPLPMIAYMNSNTFTHLLGSISMTLNFTVGDIGRTPLANPPLNMTHLAARAISLSEADWNSHETSAGFSRSSMLSMSGIEEAFKRWSRVCEQRIRELLELEEKNNRVFIDLFELQGELSPEVSDKQINLYRPDGETDIKRLLSYALGGMMGRYSLDKPGLIYAHTGNEDFDASQYKTFPADADGIIPITEIDWFEDAAARRFEQFVGVCWPKEHLEENLKFVAESLGLKSGEQPRDTIRRYFADDFYKDHLQTYKRRPIYWMFTSGKLGAFQCLVYLHRYNEGTLARMRTEYVIPLQGKINSRIDQLEGDKGKAAPTHRKRLEKEQELLKKQQAELVKFDENLRHYADMRIKLDLDDGVKVNYGKFGDLLANVTQVCGKADDDE